MHSLGGFGIIFLISRGHHAQDLPQVAAVAREARHDVLEQRFALVERTASGWKHGEPQDMVDFMA